VVPQIFDHTPDFGKRVTCILSRNGDLISNVHLVATLPKIPVFKDEHDNIDLITKFAWVRRIGFALIKRVEIEIGGELMDRQYGDWLNIWYELTVPKNKDLRKMLGDVKALTEFTNGKKSYKLFIPLQFWFNRITGLALPVISLQYNHVKLNLEINDFEKCSIISPTHYIEIEHDFVNFEEGEYLKQVVNGVVSCAKFSHFDIVTKRLYFWRITDNGFISVKTDDSGILATEETQRDFLFERDSDNNLTHRKYLIVGQSSKFEVFSRLNARERIYKKNRKRKCNNICLKDAFLLVEYIYLDTEERNRFYRAKHEYLIEQLLYNGEKTIDGINKSYKIGFTHTCKELFWVAQLSLAQNCRLNQLFNYTNCLVPNEKINESIPNNCNIIKKDTLLFNSLERLSFRDSEYFTWIQPYQHHRNAPSELGEGIHIYSFSLHPEKHQPAGTANMTRIDHAMLKLNVINSINCKNTAKLRIYGLVNNVLRIASGISGLVFANDIYNY
jgi:hypothetical protein